MAMNSRFFIMNGLFLPFVMGLLFAETTGILAEETVFLCLHAAFGLYAAVSIYEVAHLKENGVFSYVTIFLFCQFFGQVFIGNFSYLIGSEEHNAWSYMNKSMLLCFLAVFAGTTACYMQCFSRWGRQLSEHFVPNIQVERVYLGRCILMFICSFAVVVFMVMTGMRGYADAEVLDQVTSYTGIVQYLNYLAAGSSMVLYLLFYEYLKHPTLPKRVMFYVCFALEFSVAITSGMKKDTLIMFVCLFMIYYLVKRKVNLWFLLMFIVAIFGLYQFVDAYRTALRLATFSGDRLDTFLSVISGLGGDQGLYSDRLDASDVMAAFFARVSLTDALSLIVEYKDVVGLGPNDPTFLQDLLAAPFAIFLPRFLLPFKAMSTYGLWVTHTVMGMPDTVMSSSYVTVEGFLYLAGGVLMVPVGIFVVSAVLNFCSAFCRVEEKSPVFVVIFFLIAVNMIEPSTPIDMVTGVVRSTIIYTLMGLFLIKTRRTETKK